MALETLQDLYLDELKDVLSVENQLIKALPKMAKKATTPELKEAIEMHLEETRGHAEKVTKLIENLGQKARAKMCEGIKGIIDEGKEMMEEAETDEVLDALIIAGAQRAEHYEIAAYGTLRTYAQILGDKEGARVLQQIADEEGAADKKLTKLAQSGINLRAAEPEEVA